MKLKALYTTTGDYGTIPAGGVFDCPDDIAEVLIKQGTAEKTSSALTHTNERGARLDSEISSPFNREVIKGEDAEVKADQELVDEAKAAQAVSTAQVDTAAIVQDPDKVDEPVKEEKGKGKTKEEKGPITTKDLK